MKQLPQIEACPAILADRFRTVRYNLERETAVILDRRKYPFTTEYLEYDTVEGVAVAIETMVIQGGPPLAYAAALGMVIATRQVAGLSEEKAVVQLEEAASRLINTRPTADDLHHIIPTQLKKILAVPAVERFDVALAYANEEIARGNYVAQWAGYYAAQLIQDGDQILTHCIAGAALCWMLWYAKQAGKEIHLIASETRPYFQGARLTAQSAVEMGIECTIITDGMSAHLMSLGEIDKFICAADRLTLDGHITNKIGTLQHAIAAHHFGIPFYVLGYDGPDPMSPRKDDIIIEERNPEQIFMARGESGMVRTAIYGVQGRYPAFDITPPHLIEAVITDRGVFAPTLLYQYFTDNEKET